MKTIFLALSVLILCSASMGLAAAEAPAAAAPPLPLDHAPAADSGELFALESLDLFNPAPEARSFCGDMDCQTDSECQDACPSATTAFCDGCVCIFDGRRSGGHGGGGIPGD